MFLARLFYLFKCSELLDAVWGRSWGKPKMVVLEILWVVSAKFVQLCVSSAGMDMLTVGCFHLEKCRTLNLSSDPPTRCFHSCWCGNEQLSSSHLKWAERCFHFPSASLRAGQGWLALAVRASSCQPLSAGTTFCLAPDVELQQRQITSRLTFALQDKPSNSHQLFWSTGSSSNLFKRIAHRTLLFVVWKAGSYFPWPHSSFHSCCLLLPPEDSAAIRHRSPRRWKWPVQDNWKGIWAITGILISDSSRKSLTAFCLSSWVWCLTGNEFEGFRSRSRNSPCCQLLCRP